MIHVIWAKENTGNVKMIFHKNAVKFLSLKYDNFSPKYSSKTLYDSPIMARYGVSSVSLEYGVNPTLSFSCLM